MELRESIESINKQLADEFGHEFGHAVRFRVVFSEDQFEKRLTNYTAEGFELLYPEVRLLPKYKQYCRERYILERLVPVTGETDLVVKVSYEPAWVFQDRHGNYLPPWFDGCKFVIEALLSQVGRNGQFKKYTDPNESEEMRETKLNKIQSELFGNETSVGDHLAYGTGISLTSPNGEKKETIQ